MGSVCIHKLKFVNHDILQCTLNAALNSLIQIMPQKISHQILLRTATMELAVLIVVMVSIGTILFASAVLGVTHGSSILIPLLWLVIFLLYSQLLLGSLLALQFR